MSKNKKCSFCNCNLDENNKGIEGIGAVICHQCLEYYGNLEKLNEFEIGNSSLKQNKNSTNNSITPRSIYEELSKKVIGQDEAKKILSVALFRHYKRIMNPSLLSTKANILLIGPTGVGKTLLAQTMASIIHVPIAICDATVYTEAGYVGEDVENILLRLLENANYDIGLAEKGIVFLDEFDKLARKSENPSITRDVSGEGVQNALLKIIEGSIINVPPHGGRKHPYEDYIKFDTKNVLFICGGAFDGLYKEKPTSVGFEKVEEKEKDLPSLLTKYGIIPEIIGRLPIIATLKDLTIEELETILVSKETSLIQEYKNILQDSEIALEFTEDAIHEIAIHAKELGLGARALKKVVEKIMLEPLFEAFSDSTIKSININKEYVRSNC